MGTVQKLTKEAFVDGAPYALLSNTGRALIIINSELPIAERAELLKFANVDLNEPNEIYVTVFGYILNIYEAPDILDVAEMMVEHGADVNATDSSDFSILHASVALTKHDRHANIIKFLLNKGADARAAAGNIDTVDEKIDTIRIALRNPHIKLDVIKLLVNYIGTNSVLLNDMTPLIYVCCCNNDMISLDIIKYLIELGANINAQNNRGETALHILVDSMGQQTPTILKAMELLLTNGANPDIKSNMEHTPLMSAIHNAKYTSGVVDHIKLLLSFKADVNIVSMFHGTAMNIAVHIMDKLQPTAEIIELLKAAGGAITNPNVIVPGIILDYLLDKNVRLQSINAQLKDELESAKNSLNAVIRTLACVRALSDKSGK
jgi:ankyrin repeat protein